MQNLTLERTLDGQLVGKAILTWDGVDYSASSRRLKKRTMIKYNPSVKADLFACLS